MRIITAPARKMKEDDSLPFTGLPVFLKETEEIKETIDALDYEGKKRVWECGDRIARENLDRFAHMNLYSVLTPAILSYDGIQYAYMAPEAFDETEFQYVQKHLRILSGFYGVLKPMDGVTPYRLEIKARLSVNGCKDLYAYWGNKLYEEVRDESHVIVNLASKEYSRAMEPYLKSEDTYLTCVFGVNEGGRVVQKGVYAKMARGMMIRWMAEHQIEDYHDLKLFDEAGYVYSEKHSDENHYVFLKNPKDS